MSWNSFFVTNSRKRKGRETLSKVEGQNRGRLEGIRDLVNNESKGRTHGVNKMDTATNSPSQKCKQKLDLVRVNGVEGINVVDGR